MRFFPKLGVRSLSLTAVLIVSAARRAFVILKVDPVAGHEILARCTYITRHDVYSMRDAATAQGRYMVRWMLSAIAPNDFKVFKTNPPTPRSPASFFFLKSSTFLSARSASFREGVRPQKIERDARGRHTTVAEHMCRTPPFIISFLLSFFVYIVPTLWRYTGLGLRLHFLCRARAVRIATKCQTIQSLLGLCRQLLLLVQ